LDIQSSIGFAVAVCGVRVDSPNRRQVLQGVAWVVAWEDRVGDVLLEPLVLSLLGAELSSCDFHNVYTERQSQVRASLM
jgi:hypothetical protein